MILAAKVGELTAFFFSIRPEETSLRIEEDALFNESLPSSCEPARVRLLGVISLLR